jgi:glutathione S-transferase
MKVYDSYGAPNPKRLQIYLAEKGIEIEKVTIDLVQGEQRTEAFRKKNPMCGVPVLELDDGSCHSESMAIIEYLEELHPEPPMIGTTPEERIEVRRLERMGELGLLQQVARILQSSHPFFARRYKQGPDGVANGEKNLYGTLKVLDGIVGGRPFLAGDRPSIADFTAFAALEFATMMGHPVDLGGRPNIQRWFENFSQRPSAKA